MAEVIRGKIGPDFWTPRRPGPVNRYRQPSLFDYDNLFDGNIWRLDGRELKGRSKQTVKDTLRRAGYRRGIRLRIEEHGDGLVLQARKAN